VILSPPDEEFGLEGFGPHEELVLDCLPGVAVEALEVALAVGRAFDGGELVPVSHSRLPIIEENLLDQLPPVVERILLD
jgi:hypothetical protein